MGRADIRLYRRGRHIGTGAREDVREGEGKKRDSSKKGMKLGEIAGNQRI